jgi:hypothetical protein
MKPLHTEPKYDGLRAVLKSNSLDLTGFKFKHISIEWRGNQKTPQAAEKECFRKAQEIFTAADPLLQSLKSACLITPYVSGLSTFAGKLASAVYSPDAPSSLLLSVQPRQKKPICNTETPERVMTAMFSVADPRDSQYKFTLITHADKQQVFKLQQNLNQFAAIPNGMPTDLDSQFWLYAIQNHILPEVWDNPPFDPFDL